MSNEAQHTIGLTESEIAIILKLLEEKIRYKKSIIKKCHDRPSDTIRSWDTIKRTVGEIDELQDFETKIAHTFQF